MTDVILTLNAGSSSIKFALFTLSLERAAHGEIEGIGTAPHLRAFDSSDKLAAERRWTGGTHEEFLSALLEWVEGHLSQDRLAAAGHRIVHGGTDFIQPVRLDPAVMTKLEGLIPLAPLHQPHNLNAVRAVAKLRPDLPQIGCFDTAFHSSMDDTTRRFGLPRALEASGIRRYGFHGLSYEFIAGRLREIAPELATRRVIVAHLGNGASLCALKDGQSRDTTMGLTALDGILMGTRPGALDPGVTLYLLQQRGMDAAGLEDLLYNRSGLLGVSGISSDMRVLQESADPHARDAIDLFTFRIAREIGALTSSLGGLDGLVFTAGIGENDAAIRKAVCERIAWLGVTLDEAQNQVNALQINAQDSKVKIWVVPTDEEMMIARHTRALMEPA